MTGADSRYHHGDLSMTLVESAVRMLATDGDADLSIRAVARAAGVSSAAPYRHFPDRSALLAAVAAAGFGELMTVLRATCPEPSGRTDIGDLAVAYVRFATERPGLFRVMFAEGGQRGSATRREATAVVHEYLDAGVRRWLGIEDPGTVTTGLWALVHGMACLYTYENLEPADAEDMAQRVRDTVDAVLTVDGR
ncbi:TetR/AcrR family transcriptional regulator [Pseudoclavibacter chungangensis]|uniref:TetR/AcrR family transcriptional regulator n=1 Tax=Pseudoclavibacter chungangensis TaxID=587635 RepID=A0A7J5BZN6_9MICO|nr:TetR/AcrR family transcriptional regulator [Pseudoclavibacter chungangensis]KAB1659615.1 TetR/AcrR family transcriptional regulator [Pseudoclavibacter chungangensis]NYJ67441.1 AcrR family transcriptional regulator [Pseudoclavibacter chungangensis]